MQKLEIGDFVIPLSDPFNKFSQKRKKGVICEVTAVMYCSKEGHQLVNVNNNQETRGSGGVFGCFCGELHLNNNLAWTVSTEFVRASSIEKALEMAVNNEDWDLAIRLRDINKK